ncbi:MAG: hypothetical protein ACLP50_11740 [Solirubrobacteraceae bacterium]
MLELYRADVFLLDRSPGRNSGLLTDLKVFLDDVRLHEWADGLPANPTYYRGEILRDPTWLPRFIDEFVMGQLETPAALDRLPDLTQQLTDQIRHQQHDLTARFGTAPPCCSRAWARTSTRRSRSATER